MELTSPNGARVVTSYVADCGGATTDYATVVNLHVPGQGFQDSIGDILSLFGQHEIQMQWLDDKRLQIRCGDCVRTEIALAVVYRHDVDIDLQIPRVR